MIKRHLSEYRSNTFSQNGEDGVLSELFSRVGMTNRYFCEFGAWDGRRLSNCFKLLTEGWSGLMIEGEPDRFRDLEQTAAEFPKLATRLAFVDWRKGSDLTLDMIPHYSPYSSNLWLLCAYNPANAGVFTAAR